MTRYIVRWSKHSCLHFNTEVEACKVLRTIGAGGFVATMDIEETDAKGIIHRTKNVDW